MTTRRRFLGGVAAAGLTAATIPARANTALYLGNSRAVTLRNLRFNQSATFLLGRNESVSRGARRELNHLLRDHYSGAIGRMDPALIPALMDLQSLLGVEDATFDIVSAYRSKKTNQMLRERSSKVATYSLHMRGRAIDIRLPGVPMTELRDAALDLGVGGVGYYSRFIHLDTGPVRHW